MFQTTPSHRHSDLHTAGSPFPSALEVPGTLSWKPSRNSWGWVVPEQGNGSPAAPQETEAVLKHLLWKGALMAALALTVSPLLPLRPAVPSPNRPCLNLGCHHYPEPKMHHTQKVSKKRFSGIGNNLGSPDQTGLRTPWKFLLLQSFQPCQVQQVRLLLRDKTWSGCTTEGEGKGQCGSSPSQTWIFSPPWHQLLIKV